MKHIRMMYLKNCPHCKKAFALMEELKKEDPRLAELRVELIEESEQPKLAERMDYWYVPSFFLGEEKLWEGAVDKEALRKVFSRALSEN